jgi:hypothetical protein
LIIEVQGSLLHQLAEAEQDDNITDFSSLIATAVRTRRKAENVLNDLYNRAEEQEKQTEQPEPPPSERTVRKPTYAASIEEEAPKENRLKFWRRSSTTAPKRTSQESSPNIAPQSPNITRQSTAAFSDITRRSTFSVTSPSWNPEAIYPIAEDNNFGGFCKGAWRAQRYELSKSVSSSIKSLGRKYHCTKCSYILAADMRDKDHPCFDDRIYKLDDMRFRLLFLLKSHLPQKAARDPRRYGCILCTLAGKPLRTFSGEGHLLEHIFHHQDQVFGDVRLVGPISVEASGVKTETLRDFDILFDRGEDFALPPSMLDDNQSLDEVVIDFPEEIFGNVWADQKR